MKKTNIILLATFIGAIIVIFYSFSSSQDPSAYLDAIRQEREERDRFMRTSSESPLTEEEKKNFRGLSYFEPSPRYRIIASLQPIKSKNVLVLTTSDGKEQSFIPYAYAEFELDNVQNRLLILEPIGRGPMRGKLFLPFADNTSGIDTYGAGRYLELEKIPGSSTITLDFNKAYNPYCAYNDSYSCPLPPAENVLKVGIKAGEKRYKTE